MTNHLEQFINSTLVFFKNIENMTTYIQKIPTNVKYPCMIVSKVDVNSKMINSFMFNNRVTIYFRMFDKNEITVRNKSQNIIQGTLENLGRIPILNEDGSPSARYIRVEDLGKIEIEVDENDVFCNEISFSFETSHQVNISDFEKIVNIYTRNKN